MGAPSDIDLATAQAYLAANPDAATDYMNPYTQTVTSAALSHPVAASGWTEALFNQDPNAPVYPTHDFAGSSNRVFPQELQKYVASKYGTNLSPYLEQVLGPGNFAPSGGLPGTNVNTQWLGAYVQTLSAAGVPIDATLSGILRDWQTEAGVLDQRQLEASKPNFMDKIGNFMPGIIMGLITGGGLGVLGGAIGGAAGLTTAGGAAAADLGLALEPSLVENLISGYGSLSSTEQALIQQLGKMGMDVASGEDINPLSAVLGLAGPLTGGLGGLSSALGLDTSSFSGVLPDTSGFDTAGFDTSSLGDLSSGLTDTGAAMSVPDFGSFDITIPEWDVLPDFGVLDPGMLDPGVLIPEWDVLPDISTIDPSTGLPVDYGLSPLDTGMGPLDTGLPDTGLGGDVVGTMDPYGNVDMGSGTTGTIPPPPLPDTLPPSVLDKIMQGMSTDPLGTIAKLLPLVNAIGGMVSGGGSSGAPRPGGATSGAAARTAAPLPRYNLSGGALSQPTLPGGALPAPMPVGGGGAGTDGGTGLGGVGLPNSTPSGALDYRRYGYGPEWAFFNPINKLTGATAMRHGGALRRYADGGNVKGEIGRLRELARSGRASIQELRLLRAFEAASGAPAGPSAHTSELTTPLAELMGQRGALGGEPLRTAPGVAIPQAQSDLESALKLLRNPRGYAPGGATSRLAKGPGGGQDDKIEALLSDGEYVMDAEVVSSLGDGSNEEGARKLDAWRERLRTHKRSAPGSKIPPAARSPESYMKKGALRRAS